MSSALPEGWIEQKIAEIGKLSTSSVDKKIVEGEQIVRLLNYMDVYRSNVITNKINFQLTSSKPEKIASSKVRMGDVFFTPSSETPDDIGHSAVVTEELENVLQSYHLVRLRFDNEKLADIKFKGFMFRSPETMNQFRLACTGTTRFTLSLGEIGEVNIRFPKDLKEQEKIAAVLGAVDDVIEKTALKIKKLNDLKKSTMNELLTRGIGHTDFKPSELGQIPKNWEVKSIGDISKICSGKDYKHLNEGSIPVYGTGGFMLFVDDYLYEGESVGIGRKGTIDKPVFLNGKFWTVDTLFYTSNFKDVVPKFLYYVFLTIEWRRYNEASGVPSLSKTTIEHISCSLPPLPEQKQIASILDSISTQIEKVENKLSSLNALKKSLMQDLLSGKVRVRV